MVLARGVEVVAGAPSLLAVGNVLQVVSEGWVVAAVEAWCSPP